ncbi:MAG: UDP-N-acetylmuramoyl-tripeptide--D-alanyl-D-alanine ligase [Thermodesulfobacteriota bacterium]
MDFTAAEIAAETGGRVLAGDPARRFTTVTIDSRSVPAGALFVPLPGSRVDGHDFIGTALERGAAGSLTARHDAGAARAEDVRIAVDDTLRALQALASAWRRRLRATVIGVAGSNGKTTTKETLASVLATRGATFATPRNENSQIGAPLTVLATPADTTFLVLELGTSAPGELDRLARMAEPDLAIVTAAYAEHLEWLGDVAGVVAAETEILDHLRPGAFAAIGSSEPTLLAAARRRARLRIRSVGEAADDDWRISAVALERDGTRFRLRHDGEAHEWRVPLLGAPAACAAAFAVATATEIGLDAGAIQRGLDAVVAVSHRLVPLTHPRLPIFVLDDSYNSNPASCRAAIDTAVALARGGDRLLLVLGDMLELGEATAAAHREVGAEIARRAPGATLIAVGAHARGLAEEARRHRVVVHESAGADGAADIVTRLVADGAPVTVLAKGSRGIGLDRVVDRLMAL